MRLAILLLISTLAYAATGDITAVRVLGSTCTAGASCNGWVAEIDLEGLSTGGTYNFGFGANNNPSTAKLVLTVTSPGYNTSGVLGTTTRTVYGTQYLRKPYPNDATKDETAGTPLTVRVSLSDFIYSGDTATVSIASGFYTGSNAVSNLAVTNGSTLAYPKPVGRWAWVPYTRETGDFLIESTVFHRFAKNGKPLAALKYTCTDQHSNTVTAMVNDMTVSTRTGDQNKVLVYAATMPVTTLTQGDVVTCNFTAYPWVGDATALLNSDLVANGGDGVTQPDERLGPFAILLDKTGAYGTVFAVVDPVNGQDSGATTWIATSQSAAETAYASANTNSYRSLGRAVDAITAYNNTNFSRNEPGGGTILLASNAISYPGRAATTQSASNSWLTITRLSTLTRDQAGFNAGTNASLKSARLRLYGISITGSSTGEVNGAGAGNTLWVDQCEINHTGQAGIYSWTLAHATRNHITAFNQQFWYYSTTKNPYALVRGNDAAGIQAGIAATMHAVLGNRNIRPRFVETGNTAGEQISDGAVVAFNSGLNMNAAWSFGSSNGQWAYTTTVTRGIAAVQNLIEKVTATEPIIQMSADGNSATVNNGIAWHNTFVGERSNFAYNDAGSTSYPKPNWSIVGNVLDNYNIKTDTFATANGARTGNWSAVWMVGGSGNFLRVSSAKAYFGPEFDGLFSIVTGTGGFVSNKSFNSGDAGGNGDYHLTASSSAINLIGTGSAILPYDLDGVARKNDGTGAAGAYEFVTAATSRKRVKVIAQ